MDLQEQLEVGKQAEDFLKYIAEHPYFEAMLERVKMEYARQILDLPPVNDSFVVLKSAMDAISDLMNSVRGDVYLGAEAFKQINNLPEEPKGLL